MAYRSTTARGALVAVCGFVLALASSLPATSAPRYSAQVYLLRGFMNVFSPGLDTLTESLQKRGIPASVHNHLAWPGLAEAAIQNYRSGRVRSIVLIGHSLGAGAAASMAEQLGQARVPVTLVVTLDAPSKPTIPTNVRRAYNFYVSDGIGTSSERASKDRKPLVNVDRKDLGHVSITTAPDIQRKIIGYVMGALAAEAPPPAPAGATAPAGPTATAASAAAAPRTR